MKEIQLAEYTIQYLNHFGIETYQEVPVNHNKGKRVDIVGVKDDKLYCIETKMSLSMSVIEQAFDNLLIADYSIIAVPMSYSSGRTFARKVCDDYNLNILEIFNSEDIKSLIRFSNGDITLHENSPNYNFKKQLLDKLDGKYNEFGKAGSKGDYYTDFKQTKSNILRFIKDNPGCTLATVVKSVKHHYASNATARSSIAKLIREGIIEELGIEKRSGVNYIYLK